MDMDQCIRLCVDCSDVCGATYRIATRRTGSNRELIRSQLAASNMKVLDPALYNEMFDGNRAVRAHYAAFAEEAGQARTTRELLAVALAANTCTAIGGA